jgi:predicted nuclease of predicted toxin-antitoxin system
VLLTHDLDFDDLMAASGAPLPSVVIFRLRNMHPDRVNSTLQTLLRQHQDVLEQGAIISVTEGQSRVRLLPLDRDGASPAGPV